MKEFYVGQDIVAIKDHSKLSFKEGDVFTIKGLKQGCCGKCTLLIDIGKTNLTDSYCTFCYKVLHGIVHYNSICFRPLDELTNIEELTNVLENTKPFEINKHE